MSEYEDVAVEIVEQEEAAIPGQTRKLQPGTEMPPPRPRHVETMNLQPEPEVLPRAVSVSPHLGLTNAEMNWAALAHASILITVLLGIFSGGIAVLLGPIIPAVIWAAHRDKSAYVVEQARQATLFQLVGIVALLALSIVGALLIAFGWVISALLVIVIVGLLLLPVMLLLTVLWVVAIVALPIAQAVYGCYAALEVRNGRPFRYRWISDLIDRYQAQT